MPRVRDLWKDRSGQPTARHPDRGGNPKAKRWLAVWPGPDGCEHTKAHARQADALRYATAMEADALRGTYVDPRRGSITAREYGEQNFLPSLVHLRPNSAATYASHLRTHVWPLYGERRMRSLTRSDMKAFVAVKSAELAPTTTETVYAVLRAMMTAAVTDGVITVNPCSRVPLPRAEPRVLEPLPPAAVVTLAEVISGRYRVAVALGASGLRFGEATGLTIPRVDFLRRHIHALEQAQNGSLAPLKTRASQRVIPADDWVLSEISAHVQRYGAGLGEVIMSTVAGRLVRRSAFGDIWRAAVKAAGLPQGTRYHDLRH